MPITMKICSYCKQYFPASRIDTEYCSPAHRQAASTKRKRSGEEKPGRAALPQRRDVPPAPDAVYPSDNPMEIPTLKLDLCADAIQVPVAKWGTISRTKRFGGTWHLYTDDSKFSALWTHPEALPATGCIATVEANFSTNEQMPLPEILHRLYRKRWLSRYWQSCGIRIVVDLNVSRKAEKYNLAGVPRGWSAFATRGYSAYPDEILRQYRIAQSVAGGPPEVFLVCGGGKKIKQICMEHGLTFMPGFDLESLREIDH